MKRVTELGYIGPDGVRVYLGHGQVMTEHRRRGLRGLGAQRDDATEGRTGPSRNSGSSGAGERGTNSGSAAAGAGSSSTDVTERRMRATKEAAAGAQRAAVSRAASAKMMRINQLVAEIERAAAECKAGDRRACVRQNNFETELRDIRGSTPAPTSGGAPAPRPPSDGAPEPRPPSSSGGDRVQTPPGRRPAPEEAPPTPGAADPLPTPARGDTTKPPNGSTVMSETETTPPQPEPQVVTPQGGGGGGGGGGGYSPPPTQFAPPEDFKPPGDASIPPSTDLVDRTEAEKEKTSGSKAGAKVAASTGGSKLLYVFGALGLAGVGYLAYKKKKSTGERT